MQFSIGKCLAYCNFRDSYLRRIQVQSHLEQQIITRTYLHVLCCWLHIALSKILFLKLLSSLEIFHHWIFIIIYIKCSVASTILTLCGWKKFPVHFRSAQKVYKVGLPQFSQLKVSICGASALNGSDVPPAGLQLGKAKATGLVS